MQAHKCPQLAQMQLRLLGPSAVGVCCQKVTEAEAMVAGGIQDVFISNEVVAAPKITRMVALAAQGGRLAHWKQGTVTCKPCHSTLNSNLNILGLKQLQTGVSRCFLGALQCVDQQ
jgi:hypothetical protein